MIFEIEKIVLEIREKGKKQKKETNTTWKKQME